MKLKISCWMGRVHEESSLLGVVLDQPIAFESVSILLLKRSTHHLGLVPVLGRLTRHRVSITEASGTRTVCIPAWTNTTWRAGVAGWTWNWTCTIALSSFSIADTLQRAIWVTAARLTANGIRVIVVTSQTGIASWTSHSWKVTWWSRRSGNYRDFLVTHTDQALKDVQ